jgi:hypothetical protein
LNQAALLLERESFDVSMVEALLTEAGVRSQRPRPELLRTRAALHSRLGDVATAELLEMAASALGTGTR